MSDPKAAALDLLQEVVLPSGYAALRLGLELYPWQIRAMDALEKPGRVALRTCNESGKTSMVIAGLVLWHMETFPGSLTITTSGAYRQIVDQLYPNLRALARHAGGEDLWRITQDHALYSPTGSRLISFRAREPGKAEGWHEPPMERDYLDPEQNLFADLGVSDEDWRDLATGGSGNSSLFIVIDEAKSVEDPIWHAFERCHPTRYLVASSPGAASGFFYDCFHRQRARWQCFHASARDCPHLWDVPERRRELEEQIEMLPEPLVDSLVWGNFPSLGEYQVFDAALVNAAMGGHIPVWGRGTLRAAVDLSNGGDETCLYVRDGNRCWLDGSWHESNDDLLAQKLILRFQQYQIRPEWVSADNGGLGRLIVNNLERRGWPVNRIDFGAPAREPRYYHNRRAEMYFRLRDRISRREVALPHDPILRDQLLWQKYIPGDGPLRLIPKKDLPSSPDRADTVAMLYDDLPAAGEYRDRQDQLARLTMRTPEARSLDDYLDGGREENLGLRY